MSKKLLKSYSISGVTPFETCFSHLTNAALKLEIRKFSLVFKMSYMLYYDLDDRYLGLVIKPVLEYFRNC